MICISVCQITCGQYCNILPLYQNLTSPSGHSSLSLLSSSWSHYNNHPPSSTSFTVFFISRLYISPSSPSNPQHGTPLSLIHPSVLSFLKQTPTIPLALSNESQAEGLLWSRGQWQKYDSNDSVISNWLTHSAATITNQPIKYLIDKWNGVGEKKTAHIRSLNGCRSNYSRSHSPSVPLTSQKHSGIADMWHFKRFWRRCSLTFLLKFTHLNTFIHLFHPSYYSSNICL